MVTTHEIIQNIMTTSKSQNGRKMFFSIRINANADIIFFEHLTQYVLEYENLDD